MDTLRVAPPYTDQQIAKIKEGLKKLTGYEPDFQIVEDPDLLGGFVALVDGKVYDNSVRLRLEQMRKLLRK